MKPTDPRFLCSLALVALAGCSRAPDAAPAQGGPPFETNSPPRETTETPPPPAPPVADPCAAFIDEFARVLAGAPGRCAADRDCACYPGGIGEASGCGGVTDALTDRVLSEIAGKYLAAGCRHTVNCAPWMCDPKCVNGECSR